MSYNGAATTLPTRGRMQKEKRERIGMSFEGYVDTPSVRFRKREDVVFLTFPMLEKETWLVHGFSTRLGGVSGGVLSSMNLSFAREEMECPEDPAAEGRVRENFRRIGRAIGFSPENLVFSAQTHTSNVRLVTAADAGTGFTRPLSWRDVDGFVTNVPGPVLATFFADCVPLFFADPVRRAIGLSHSGWRGTAARIGKCTVERMRREFGSRPEDILAVIGPSISKAAYEVSADVAGHFPLEAEEKPDGKYMLDLWAANRRILLSAGLLPEHISTAGLCTYANPELMYSHRYSKGRRGNLAAFLGIRES